MAKHFSKSERETIDQQLHKVGLELFAAHGVRAVSIDDLCQKVRISSSSFYSFYESKYDLFVTIIEQLDKTIFIDILAFMDGFTGAPVEFVGQMFDRVYKGYSGGPMIEVITRPREFEKLMLKVPTERWIKYREKAQSEYFTQLTNLGKDRQLFGPIDEGLIGELFAMLVQVMSRRDFTSRARYDAYINHMRDLFICKLTTANKSCWL